MGKPFCFSVSGSLGVVPTPIAFCFTVRTAIIIRVYYSALMHFVAFANNPSTHSPFKIMQNDPPAAISTIRPYFSAPNKCLGV